MLHCVAGDIYICVAMLSCAVLSGYAMLHWAKVCWVVLCQANTLGHAGIIRWDGIVYAIK